MTAPADRGPRFVVSYERSSSKELSKLDKSVARRIIRSVNKLSDDPRPPGCRSLVGYEGLWRIRIGDYRVIYSIEDDKLIVLIVRFAHRREAYRSH